MSRMKEVKLAAVMVTGAALTVGFTGLAYDMLLRDHVEYVEKSNFFQQMFGDEYFAGSALDRVDWSNTNTAVNEISRGEGFAPFTMPDVSTFEDVDGFEWVVEGEEFTVPGMVHGERRSTGKWVVYVHLKTVKASKTG